MELEWVVELPTGPSKSGTRTFGDQVIGNLMHINFFS